MFIHIIFNLMIVGGFGVYGPFILIKIGYFLDHCETHCVIISFISYYRKTILIGCQNTCRRIIAYFDEHFFFIGVNGIFARKQVIGSTRKILYFKFIFSYCGKIPVVIVFAPLILLVYSLYQAI